MLEQDILPKEDILKNLLAHDKPVVGHWYNINLDFFELYPCIHKSGFSRYDFNRWGVDFYDFKDLTGGLMEVVGCGMGCILIRRDVIEKVGILKTYTGMKASVDYVFFMQCRFNKIPVFVDTSYKLRHVQGWVKDI